MAWYGHNSRKFVKSILVKWFSTRCCSNEVLSLIVYQSTISQKGSNSAYVINNSVSNIAERTTVNSLKSKRAGVSQLYVATMSTKQGYRIWQTGDQR